MEVINGELVEETNLEKEKQDKSKKLLEKIELLSQKIEQEKSPLKRHIFAFQVKMLIAKIQREIDIQNLKDSYEEKRASLLTEKEDREGYSLDNIAILNNKIRAKQREMSGNEEYDIESQYFLYPKKYVQEVGGIENLTKKLKESKSIDSQQTAQRIEKMALKRQELNNLYDELKKEQENLEHNQSGYNTDKMTLDREEKSLIIKQKFNIFTRISNFFKNMVEEAKLYREEKKQMKDLRTKQREDESVIDEDFNRKMQELREQHEKAKQQMHDNQKGERESQQSQLGQDTAASFRKQMAEMSKGENTGVTQDASAQSTPQPAQTQQPTQAHDIDDNEVAL